MEAGHGGKSGRFEALKEVALEYAFMLDLAGLNEPVAEPVAAGHEHQAEAVKK